MTNKNSIYQWIDKQESFLVDMAKRIWEKPEAGLEEKFATTLQVNVLKEAGFKIKENIGGMPTAFVAEYGNGNPILGILGEYDALPGLSQKIISKQEPVHEGDPGHGCGHNLLGTAGIGAVLAIKKLIDENKIKGTIRYYGCPAEETLVGKVFMARDGVFDDLDSCLTWHPGRLNQVWASSSLAMNSISFIFRGKAAHAAAQPDMGRSALDAVELMDIGANYLREHISDSARIHYSITNGGGEPNIVPDKASVWYYIRAPKRAEVEEITERIKKIAEGATLMTETTVDWTFLSACYEVLPNDILGDVIFKNMKAIQPPKFSKEDHDLAQQLEKTFLKGQKEKINQKVPSAILKHVLHEDVVETYDNDSVLAGSTDVGDVSQITPTAQFNTATWPIGTAGHSWQATVASGSEIGYKAMLYATKILAGSMVDLYLNEKIIQDAKKEFIQKTEGNKYIFPLPEDAKPPFDQFKH
ncbi:MAG: M20 family metallopeptidase [Atribacterota bacterium]|nr:M20 family metallopeptidase [Atribacterota bacterium]